MAETAEQLGISTSKPSLFKKIAGIFHTKPQQEILPSPPQITSEPVFTPPIRETNPVSPRLSKQERKRLKQEEYEKWKAFAVVSQKQTKTDTSTRTAITEPVAAIIPTNLPHGTKERVRFYQGLTVTRNEIPWLEAGEANVPLELLTLATTRSEKFLYGSLIEGKKLNKALDQMSETELKSCDDALFIQISELIQTGQAKDVEKVHNHISKRPIFETGNQNGQRVYFIRFNRLQGFPVIIRIAAGNKSMMRTIFSVIATENYRQIRKGGKL